MELLFVLVATFVLTPTISWFASRFESLPIDLLGGSISLVVTGVALVGKSNAEFHDQWFYLLFIFIVFWIILAILVIAPFIAFKKIPQGKDFWQRASFPLSLLFSFIFSALSILHIVYASEIYKSDLSNPEIFWKSIDEMTGGSTNIITLIIVLLIYVAILSIRRDFFLMSTASGEKEVSHG